MGVDWLTGHLPHSRSPSLPLASAKYFHTPHIPFYLTISSARISLGVSRTSPIGSISRALRSNVK
jgi:hypothetical protein